MLLAGLPRTKLCPGQKHDDSAFGRRRGRCSPDAQPREPGRATTPLPVVEFALGKRRLPRRPPEGSAKPRARHRRRHVERRRRRLAQRRRTFDAGDGTRREPAAHGRHAAGTSCGTWSRPRWTSSSMRSAALAQALDNDEDDESTASEASSATAEPVDLGEEPPSPPWRLRNGRPRPSPPPWPPSSACCGHPGTGAAEPADAAEKAGGAPHTRGTTPQPRRRPGSRAMVTTYAADPVPLRAERRGAPRGRRRRRDADASTRPRRPRRGRRPAATKQAAP